MIAPSMSPERRQDTRTAVNRLAYINLESNNGAIVLNISDGGLCFHAVDPVRQSEAIHFWFLDHNHRIEADGRLAWMDETHKTGGLQFITLPAEARAQIRDWMSQPATPRTIGGKPARPHASPPELPTFPASQTNRNVVLDSSTSHKARSAKLQARALLSGFSGGLVFGILISALVAGAFVLHAYRREFGKSLIRWGERLGARYDAPTMSLASSITSPTAPQVTSVPEKGATPSATKSARPVPAKFEPLPPASVIGASTITPSASANLPAAAPAPAIASQPPPTSPPITSIEPKAGHSSEKTAPLSEFVATSNATVHAEASRAEVATSVGTKFLEVGRFRDAVWANKTTEKLKQLGFQPTVVHRGHLWMNSYQVLVGPYDSEADAALAHANLAARGFRPRSYERGSRSLTLFSVLTLNGTRLPVGDLFVTWESYIPDAIVKFEKDGSVIGTTDGKWEKRDVKYRDDAIVYRKNPDGTRTLLEIRFAGMSEALVFAKTS